MNRMTAGHSAPGWYPDPWRSGYSRWWDGVAWTERSREGAPPTPTVEPSPPAETPAAASAAAAPAPAPEDHFRRMAEVAEATRTTEIPRVAPHAALPPRERMSEVPRRRPWAIAAVAAGILLALVGGATVAWSSGALESLADASSAQSSYVLDVQDLLAASIAEADEVAVESVECPDLTEQTGDAEFECVATLSTGEKVAIVAHIEGDGEKIVWMHAAP